MLALSHEARWNVAEKRLGNRVRYGLGRRMTTSSKNRVSPTTDVTPDCVVQVTHKEGFVAEAKLSLPKDESKWDPIFTQLLKYDDNLLGWWTPNERIALHDIIALVPLARAVRFADRLDAVSTRLKFERNVSVVGFFKQSGATKSFISLKKERGKISDAGLDQRLRDVKLIDFAHIIREHGDRKFVEHMPPIPYILQILWDNLFVKYAADVPKDESKGWHPLVVTIDKVTSDLQENYGFKSTGSRSPQIPQPSFIRKALDALIDFRLAERKMEGEYLIKYKRTRKDTLEKFGRLHFEFERKPKRTSVDMPLLRGL